MKLRESQRRDIDVFHVAGEIDLHYAPALRALFQLKVKQRCSALVVDLSEVSFIDSTGISVLLEYLRDAAEFGGKFCLAGLTDHVRHVFEIVRLDQVLAIFDSVNEAGAALCNDGSELAAEPLFWRAGTDGAPSSQPTPARRTAS